MTDAPETVNSSYTIFVRPEYVVMTHKEENGNFVRVQWERKSAEQFFEAGYVGTFRPRSRLQRWWIRWYRPRLAKKMKDRDDHAAFDV